MKSNITQKTGRLKVPIRALNIMTDDLVMVNEEFRRRKKSRNPSDII